MKNILVLAGGADSDEAVFVTALAAARPLRAHLEFCHLQVDPGEAASWEPHSEFVRGSGVREMMERLKTESIARTAVARSHFEQFCEASAIVVGAEAGVDGGVSASWREEVGNTERLMFCARHHDLTVSGRRTRPNGLPPHLILVMGAYGHSRARQVIFGGFTQSVLETADVAVFLMH